MSDTPIDSSNYSRRQFLAAGLATPLAAAQSPPPILNVDYAKLVSRADLIYETPVARSEEGIPIGNGRMRSLVWTASSALKLQINRVDVYPCNSYTSSFFERNSDYCGGCGFVDIDLAAFGEDVFPTISVRIEGGGAGDHDGEAIKVARDIVRNESAGQIVVHGVDGRIREHGTYGMPPIQDPPGKKSAKIEKAVRKITWERLAEDPLASRA